MTELLLRNMPNLETVVMHVCQKLTPFECGREAMDCVAEYAPQVHKLGLRWAGTEGEAAHSERLERFLAQLAEKSAWAVREMDVDYRLFEFIFCPSVAHATASIVRSQCDSLQVLRLTGVHPTLGDEDKMEVYELGDMLGFYKEGGARAWPHRVYACLREVIGVQTRWKTSTYTLALHERELPELRVVGGMELECIEGGCMKDMDGSESDEYESDEYESGEYESDEYESDEYESGAYRLLSSLKHAPRGTCVHSKLKLTLDFTHGGDNVTGVPAARASELFSSFQLTSFKVSLLGTGLGLRKKVELMSDVVQSYRQVVGSWHAMDVSITVHTKECKCSGVGSQDMDVDMDIDASYEKAWTIFADACYFLSRGFGGKPAFHSVRFEVCPKPKPPHSIAPDARGTSSRVLETRLKDIARDLGVLMCFRGEIVSPHIQVPVAKGHWALAFLKAEMDRRISHIMVVSLFRFDMLDEDGADD